MADLWIIENPKKTEERSLTELLVDRYSVRRFHSLEGPFPPLSPHGVLIQTDHFCPDGFAHSPLKEHPVIVLGAYSQNWLGHSQNMTYCKNSSELFSHLEKKTTKKTFKFFDLVLYHEDFYFCILPEQYKYFLSPKETKILKLLIENQDQECLEKDRLKEEIWNQIKVSDRTLDSHISHLRQKLNPHGLTIQSIYGRGFRLAFLNQL